MWPWLMIVAGTLLIVGALIARHRILRDYHAGLARVSRETVADDVVAPVVVDEPEPLAPMPVMPEQASPEPAPAEPAPHEPAPEPEPEPLPPTGQIRAVSADEVPIFVVTASDPSTRTVEETAPTELLGPERPAPEPVLPPRPAFARATDPPPPAAAPEPASSPAPVAPPTLPTTDPALLFADQPIGHRLSTAPTLRLGTQEVPLQEWLRYYADGDAWSGVIQSITDRITGDEQLRPWFGGMDKETLRRHVMTTMMMLAGEGVTVGALRRLAGAHLDFVRAGGEPVTAPVWARLAATLANALREHRVPESAIRGVEVTAAPLRSAIVAR
ncbi:hypothetical protein GCM10022415_13490 [Knoellia locipacati]|uniref:Uncharacterized protein n=1 Tax=Knoellia locipacati TaxID=882824 RepID=A0A512SZF6_9MICO|nr:hypothetical protein [Knoellia locipacati]GEQ13299.1 hypothetical protein KLO01_13460 [Knoellia locipacati]